MHQPKCKCEAHESHSAGGIGIMLPNQSRPNAGTYTFARVLN